MKTSVMKVHDMLSVLSVPGVERRIGEVPGVESVTVDFAAGRATVRFDETRLNLADIRSNVRQSGSKDEATDDEDKDKETEASKTPDAPSADIKPVAMKTPPAAASADASAPATGAMKGTPDSH